MKLPGINYNWRVQNISQRDIYAPQKVANAQAQAASAWSRVSYAEAGAAGQEASAAKQIGRVYEQIGGYVVKAGMQMQQESYETDAQNAYNKSMEQINELENKLYSKGSIDMKDPAMEGVNYDDSYEIVDGVNVKTMNTGYAPVHEVGQQVWSVQSQGIVGNFGSELSEGARKIFSSKIRPQLEAKTQNMGRHVIKMGLADKQGKIDRAIFESNRVGDTPGAIRIASEAHDAGYIDRSQMDKYANNSLQQGDLMRFNRALSVANTDADLNKVSHNALFTDSYLTPAQKAQVSNQALAKKRANRAEYRAQLAEWRDGNEMNALIAHYEGKMKVSDLIESKDQYDRAGFTRMLNRFEKPVQHVSDQGIVRSFGEEIINTNFENRDPTERYGEIRTDMNSAVKRGDLSVDDYTKFNELIQKQEKAPFNRQQYTEAKKSLFVDMVGTLDARTLEEINNAGVDIESIISKKMGQGNNKAVLAIRAFEDLNAYVRMYGNQANPVDWWKTNKEAYKYDAARIGESFSSSYQNDAITLSNGKMDIRGTQDNITRNYTNGVYGPVGSRQAMMEYSKRAAVLKGVDPLGMMK